MAYDEDLADRVRAVLKRKKGITEKKMFGGLAFLVNGNMACGIVGGELMLRLGDEGAANALRKKHTREMDFTGKPIKSMLYVAAQGIRSQKTLKGWVDQAITFAKSLPKK